MFRVARRIVHRHLGENDSNMTRNGEGRVQQSLMPAANVVFDVGANRGEWSLAALSVNPALELHCFEPAPEAFQRLKSAVPSAHLNNVGLGAEPASLELCIFGDNGELSSLYRGAHTPIRTERIAITTLDEYAKGIPRIDFLKIDVEGHERAVLEGARQLLSEGRIGAVQFEYSGWYAESRSLLKDMFALLDGFKFAKIMPWGLLPVTYALDLENYQLANYLAIHVPGVPATEQRQ